MHIPLKENWFMTKFKLVTAMVLAMASRGELELPAAAAPE